MRILGFKFWLNAFGFFFLTGVLPTPLDAQDRRLILEEQPRAFSLDGHLSLRQDKSKALSIIDMILMDSSLQFTPFEEGMRLKDDGVYWAKCILHNPEFFNLNGYILSLSKTNYISVYVLDGQNNILFEDMTGNFLPAARKKLRFGNKFQRVRLEIPVRDLYKLYVRYDGNNKHPIDIDISLSDRDYYESTQYIINSRRDWIFIGFALTMILFHFVFFFGTQYKAFLYHGLFILGILVFTLDFFGITNDLPVIRSHPYMVQFVDLVAVAIVDIAYFQFIRHYMNLKDTMPRWDQWFRTLVDVKMAFYTFLIILHYTTFREPLVDRIGAAFLISQFGLVLVFLLPLVRIQRRKAVFLLAGTGLMLLAIILNTISIINGHGIWTTMTEIGLSGEILVFTAGIAVRFRELRSEELRAAQLKSLDDFKTRFYTNITHEIRSPLTVIQGMTDLSRKSIEKGDKKASEKALQSISHSAQKVLNLVNDMLDLSKLETSKMPLKTMHLDVVELTQSIWEEYEPLAIQYEVRWDIDTQMESLYMEIDPDKYHMCLDNLLSNALKFTPRGGTISTSLASMETDSGKQLCITITDNGIGIEDIHQQYIFDRYYQVSDAKSNQQKGNGVGLSIVRELLEMMDGSISVDSRPGQGSAFTITLPVKDSGTTGQPITSDRYSGSPEVMQIPSDPILEKKKPVLLVVEDNPEVRDYLKTLLSDRYHILEGADGIEGLEIADSHIPDLIISDVIMPRKDGIEMSRAIKESEKTSHIPIILLTGKVESKDKLKGLEAGVDAYLTKPFQKEELFIRLDKLMALRTALQDKYSKFALTDQPEVLKSENAFLFKVNALIEENILNPDFTVEHLAKALFMSRMQLHRKLKAMTNRSASNYIRNYRLYKAKPILMDVSKSIADVAWEVGFQDPNYFSKSFAKEFGISPSEFREKHF